jgi:hypothetical protein
VEVKPSRRELALVQSVGDNRQTKLAAPGIYGSVTSYFAALREAQSYFSSWCRSGESVKTFASCFENGRIIGIDNENRGFDFSSHPNVRFELSDQRDAARLSEVCATHAPRGIDIIIDDAIPYRSMEPEVVQGAVSIFEAGRSLHHRGLRDRVLRLARWWSVRGSRGVRGQRPLFKSEFSPTTPAWSGSPSTSWTRP